CQDFVEQPERVAKQQAEHLAGDDQRNHQWQVKDGAKDVAESHQPVVENHGQQQTTANGQWPTEQEQYHCVTQRQQKVRVFQQVPIVVQADEDRRVQPCPVVQADPA